MQVNNQGAKLVKLTESCIPNDPAASQQAYQATTKIHDMNLLYI